MASNAVPTPQHPPAPLQATPGAADAGGREGTAVADAVAGVSTTTSLHTPTAAAAEGSPLSQQHQPGNALAAPGGVLGGSETNAVARADMGAAVIDSGAPGGLMNDQAVAPAAEGGAGGGGGAGAMQEREWPSADVLNKRIKMLMTHLAAAIRSVAQEGLMVLQPMGGGAAAALVAGAATTGAAAAGLSFKEPAPGGGGRKGGSKGGAAGKGAGEGGGGEGGGKHEGGKAGGRKGAAAAAAAGGGGDSGVDEMGVVHQKQEPVMGTVMEGMVEGGMEGEDTQHEAALKVRTECASLFPLIMS